MSDDGDHDLEARIKRAREGLGPKPKSDAAEKYGALSLAWRMTLELVVGAGIGVAIGWSLDDLFDTGPIFLIAIGLLGFAAGVKTMLATAKEVSRSTQSDEDRSDDR